MSDIQILDLTPENVAECARAWKCPVCGKMICVHDKKCYNCKTS